MKAGLIASTIFWLAGFLVSTLRKKGSIRLSFRTVVKTLVILAVGGVILLTSMVLRIGSISGSTIAIAAKKFINYAFGHVGAIDDWLNTNLLQSNLTLGGQTFIGISRYLGYSDRAQGIYAEYYVGETLSTNVYTYFRGIYQDYGLIGSALFFVALGLIMGYVYKKAGSHQRQGASVAGMILALTYAWSLYYIVSLFSYVSFIVAFVLFCVFLSLAYSERCRVSLPRLRVISGCR